MAPMFSKNLFFSKAYPASKIIGGSKTKKKNSGENWYRVKSVRKTDKKAPIATPMIMAAALIEHCILMCGKK